MMQLSDIYNGVILWSYSPVHIISFTHADKHHNLHTLANIIRSHTMDTIPAQSTPSQQTGDGLSVLKTGHYLADRRPGTIITCKETPKGEWEQVSVYKPGEPDIWSRHNSTSLKVSHYPQSHAICGSVAITNAFGCLLPPCKST